MYPRVNVFVDDGCTHARRRVLPQKKTTQRGTMKQKARGTRVGQKATCSTNETSACREGGYAVERSFGQRKTAGFHSRN